MRRLRSSIPVWTARAADLVGGTSLLRAVGDRFSVARNGLLPRLKHRMNHPFQILIYHRVQAVPRPFSLDTVDVPRFDAHMRHLARHYRTLSLSEILKLAAQGTVPPRTVAVTFDDGYRDNLTHASGILERHRIPATVFLATGCIGTGRALWHDQALCAFEHTPKSRYKDAGHEGPIELTSRETREATAHHVLGRLKKMGHEERERSLDALFEELEVDRTQVPRDLMLDWEDVREMARRGFEIGSHTVTHPILSREPMDRVQAELGNSKRTIEAEIGHEVTLFAYPNGTRDDYTPRVLEAVRAAGYRCALTTVFGSNVAGDDPFEWRRGTPWEEDRSLFHLKLALYRAMAVERR